MKSRPIIPATIALLLIAWMPVTASGASPAELETHFLSTIDELLPGMGAEKIEDRQESQMAFERVCMENSTPDKKAEREALCKSIMQRVGPDVALPARVWLLRKVEPIGRAEVVAPLATLLGDPNEQIRELARRALQNNPAPEAGAPIRAELAKAKEEGPWRVALINALAFRRDTEAVPQLAKLCEGTENPTAAAAITALGRIGDDYSVQALVYLRKTARPALRAAVVDASFHAGEALLARGAKQQAAGIYTELAAADQPEHVRITALQGLTAVRGADAIPELMKLINGSDERLQLVAARCAQSIPGQNVTKQLAAALKDASPDVQAVLLDVLGKRGDKSALPAVTKCLDAANPDVRAAAIGAMRYIGNGSTVTPLAKIAATSTGPERDAARESLKWMQGQDVDETILSSIGKSDDRVKAELVRAAAVRLLKPALPALLECANDPDESVRVPVIYNIGKLAMPQDLEQVLQAFSKLEANQNQGTAKEALVRICSRISGESERTQPLIDVLANAKPKVQVVVLQTLGSLRGQSALEAIRGSLKSPNKQVQKAAAKALADWGPIYCTDWVFAGPYSKDGATFTELFDVAFPPESADAVVEWKPVKGQKGPNIDLEKLAKQENCCGYLRTQIVSDSEQEIVLTFGSDDGIKVWLNGEVVHANNATRGLTVDQDKVPTRLKKGPNTLLVKITQGSGGWEMSCGLQAIEGGPPNALKIEAK